MNLMKPVFFTFSKLENKIGKNLKNNVRILHKIE